MKHIKLGLCLVAGCVAMAGCQTNRAGNSQGNIAPALTPAPEPKKADPTGINGKWVPTTAAAKSVYYNEFNNGKFVSRSPDGSKTIAAGSYKTLKSGNIQMNWYSEARKANASAVCRKLSATEMQCTSGSSVFNLKKA